MNAAVMFAEGGIVPGWGRGERKVTKQTGSCPMCQGVVLSHYFLPFFEEGKMLILYHPLLPEFSNIIILIAS